MVTVQQAQTVLQKLKGKRHGKTGFWNHVEEIMDFLMDTYPHEMYSLLKQAEDKRNNSKNKFHASKDLSSRIMGGIPPRLNQLIIHIYGDDIPYSDRQTMWQEFFRRYPLLAYAEVI